jgi:nitroreductase/FMN reductase [NAD(P)H]
MTVRSIETALSERFGEAVEVPGSIASRDLLAGIAAHRVCRRYRDEPVAPALVRFLCACALSAPSKSDLQQRDIVIVSDPDLRRRIAGLLAHMPWVGEAPAFLVFCLNARRLPRLAALREKPFPNNHLDLFFNATGDAAIALATFQIAAEAAGLGGCPISEIRNHVALVSRWLDLPERVIPFAGFCLGWPAEDGPISPRLPLALTVHENRYAENDFDAHIEAYDRRREALQPYGSQRNPERWGVARSYGWSEDKARQYAEPLRADFGTFVRASALSLD